MKRLSALTLVLLLMLSCTAYGEEYMEDPEEYIGYTVKNETRSFSEDIAETASERSLTALNMISEEGETTTVNAAGSISASGTVSEYTQQGSVAAAITASGAGSKAVLNVGKGIDAAMDWTNPKYGNNIDVAGLSISLEDGGSAEAVVAAGGISATGSNSGGSKDGMYAWAAGIHLYNSDGKADVRVKGDVKSISCNYGIGLNSHLYGGNGTSTRIEVDGDIYGSTRAIWAEHAPDGKAVTEIIVNGTVSGGENCIMAEAETGSGLTLTVWKAVPDANNAIIHGDESDWEEEMEKALQYILRVDPASEKLITVEGTKYGDYIVGREGEEIRVSATAPEGYEIESVYADSEKKTELKKGEDGKYVLTVPRCGGVVLSASTKAAEPDPVVPDTGDAGRPRLWAAMAVIGAVSMGTVLNDTRSKKKSSH